MKNRDKEKKLLESMSLMDEKYVEEAKPKEQKEKKSFAWVKIAYVAVAACLMLAVVLPITLMNEDKVSTPILTSGNETLDVGTNQSPGGTEAIATWQDHLAEYKDSPYYPLIEKLDAYYQSIKVESSDEDDALSGEFTESPVMTMAPSVGVPDEEPDDSMDSVLPDDITDNQVAGVTEADRIKRNATHIFYLKGYETIKAYSIKGLDSALVGSFSITGAICEGFYLVDGGSKILMIANAYNDRKSQTWLILVDVSDPTQMKEVNRVKVSGYVSTSRVTDGSILLFTSYSVRSEPDYHNPESFVPIVVDGNQTIPLPFEDIIMTDLSHYASYGVIYSLNATTLEVEGCKAFLGGMGEVYVSNSNVYAAQHHDNYVDQDGRRYWKNQTTIYCFPYGKGSFEQKGSVTVDGYLKDQYSMDEKDGILRVVTTINSGSHKLPSSKPSGSSSSTTGSVPDTVIPVPDTVIPVPDTAEPGVPLTSYEIAPEIMPMAADMTVTVMTTAHPEKEDQPIDVSGYDGYYGASLYCVSLDTFEVVASVERFSPDGESVRSVRFDGDYAYVCTSIGFLDPVFFFDLSDLSNITYTDTGVIEGYSSSLVNFGNGNLLGIGYENRLTMKIEIWREKDGEVISVDKYVEMVDFCGDYKAYYIDRTNQLVGLGVYKWTGTGEQYRYLLFHFDGEKLVKLVDYEDNRLGAVYMQRAVYIDGYLYLFGESFFKVVEVNLEA